MSIAHGSIGWDDEADYYFLGAEGPDGYTFVRVQLFDGRDITKPIDPTRAQGSRIICHIDSSIQRIPPKGSRCLVAFPQGQEHVPGAGVIISTIATTEQRLAADRVVFDYGPDTHIILKGKSISIQDYDNRFFGVGTPRGGGPPGIQMFNNDGSGIVIQQAAVGMFCSNSPDNPEASTIIQLTPDEIDLNVKDGAYCKIGVSTYFTYGQTNQMKGYCFIGLLPPTPAQPALWGLTGLAGVASTSVFLSL